MFIILEFPGKGGGGKVGGLFLSSENGNSREVRSSDKIAFVAGVWIFLEPHNDTKLSP